MIKGCKKNIIHITNTGSPYFEEAYFIVRRGGDIDISEDDIVKEASRIADMTNISYKNKSSRSCRFRFSYFLYGASVCSIIFGIATLIMG
ncbi:MAG: hypothetical protein IKK26_02440 [Clostridia bacterium]|nr:hypothetical protein [Clostridia bacterium]MBR6650512.1 hypothetical protein [Clostridia bacterium]